MAFDKIKHGRSKHISNYGGVGSLIETTESSIIIETFDNWGYADLNEKLAHYIIKDDRLLQRLKNRFQNLKHLVAIPTDRDSFLHQVRPKASYFPKWLYCTHCNRFATYIEWKNRWRSAGKNQDFFNPPKCSNKDCKENHLEQIRFVMTCKNGHIHDLPWEFWNNRLATDRTNEEEKEDDDNKNEKPTGPQIDFSKKCCEQQDLIYKISRENTELSGIWVECKNCQKKANLKGIFNYEQICNGKKYWLGQTNGKFHEEDCREKTSVKLKTSNSVYYANTLSSLYIPEMQNPLSSDSILQDQNQYEYTVQRQSVSKHNFDTKTLPAVESYGEGILFVLNKQKLENWEQQQTVIEQTEKIKTNAQNADWKSHQIIAKTLTPRKVLIHTLSHLLMRELQYVCGYPASSLSERLYVSETMNGFLVSAFDGTDGYLGGLSNLCNNLENLNEIIHSAISRATDCSSDPICIDSEGQGVGQLNLAACHSCTLTHETTCELSNLYLDRKLIVNKDYGYFNSTIN